jgi:hypothetical protein
MVSYVYCTTRMHVLGTINHRVNPTFVDWKTIISRQVIQHDINYSKVTIIMNDLFEICNLEESGCNPINVICSNLSEKTVEISSMLSRLRDKIPRTRGTTADNYIMVSAKRTILLDAPTYTRLGTSRKHCLVKLNYTSFFSTSQKTKEKISPAGLIRFSFRGFHFSFLRHHIHWEALIKDNIMIG